MAESRQESRKTQIHPAIRLLAALQIPLALVALGIFTFVSFRIKPLIYKEQELQNRIDEQKHALEDARNQLAKTRSAIEYVRLGVNSFQAGNFSEAVRAYDRAIELDPMNPVVFDLRGYSLLREGRVQEAVAALKRSAEIEPEYIWGHYNLALAYWAAGDRSNAVAEVRTVLQLDPTFKNVIRNDGQFKKFNASPAYRELMK